MHRIGLITITPVSDSIESIPNIRRDLSISDSRINYKDELFKSYNVCIKYPMFYMAILKEILKENLPEGTLHIRKCPLRRFREFVKTVGYDKFVGKIEFIGGNYNEIII